MKEGQRQHPPRVDTSQIQKTHTACGALRGVLRLSHRSSIERGGATIPLLDICGIPPSVLAAAPSHFGSLKYSVHLYNHQVQNDVSTTCPHRAFVW